MAIRQTMARMAIAHYVACCLWSCLHPHYSPVRSEHKHQYERDSDASKPRVRLVSAYDKQRLGGL